MRHRLSCVLRSGCLAAIALTGCTATIKAQHSAFESAIAKFAAQIATDVAKDGIGAISAGVVVGDRIVWSRGFGWADTARRRPADAETIYRVGSISKSMTAVLMACLWQDGALRLEDPVIDHLPEFRRLTGDATDVAKITLRQLASHTSGLVREPRLRNAAQGPIAEWERKVIESLAKTSFRDQPGKSYAYSNIGYGTLGLTLSRIVEKPFMAQMHERVFAPLRMTSSAFILDESMQQRLATGYLVRRRRGAANESAAAARRPEVSSDLPTREHAGRGYKVPNGGVYSTVGDLCRFATALTGAAPRKILTKKTRDEVLRVQTPERPDAGYGLGFSIRRTDEGIRAIGHGGSVAGYNAHLVFNAESDIGVAVLRNYGGGATDLGRAASDLLVALVTATRPRRP